MWVMQFMFLASTNPRYSMVSWLHCFHKGWAKHLELEWIEHLSCWGAICRLFLRLLCCLRLTEWVIFPFQLVRGGNVWSSHPSVIWYHASCDCIAGYQHCSSSVGTACESAKWKHGCCMSQHVVKCKALWATQYLLFSILPLHSTLFKQVLQAPGYEADK